MKLLCRQRPFLESILKEANQNKCRQLLVHANADQINSVSEMVLNLLKKVLSELGEHRNSVKRRREHLLKHKGGGFWSGLNDCFRACYAQ